MDNIIHYNNNIITFNGGIIGRTLQNMTISASSTTINLLDDIYGTVMTIYASPYTARSHWEVISSNPNVATASVSSTRELNITKVGAGTCTITVQLKDPNYKPSNILTFTVNCTMATTVSTAPPNLI